MKPPTTWRIIPVSKWLVTPIYKPFRPFIKGITPFRGLTNHGYYPLTSPGMILQLGVPKNSANHLRALAPWLWIWLWPMLPRRPKRPRVVSDPIRFGIPNKKLQGMRIFDGWCWWWFFSLTCSLWIFGRLHDANIGQIGGWNQQLEDVWLFWTWWEG